MPSPSVSAALREAINGGDAVLFVGAGVSVAARLPTAKELASKLTTTLKLPGLQNDNLQEVAETIVRIHGRRTLSLKLRSLLNATGGSDLSPSHFLIAWLLKHKHISDVITTNYDTLIESACQQVGVEIDVIVTGPQLQLKSEGRPRLIKLHGDFHHPELLVITKEDYVNFETDPRREALLEHVRSVARTRPFIFIGYSLQDYNFLQLLAHARRGIDPGLKARSYAAVFDENDLERCRYDFGQSGIDAFSAPDTAALLYDIASGLPTKLHIVHLAFKYPSWSSTPKLEYGGIETFLSLITNEKQGDQAEPLTHHTHEVIEVFDQFMYKDAKGESYVPRDLVYPASYYFFRSAVTSALEKLRARRSPGERVPDVVHVHFLAFAEQAALAGFRTVCTSHSLLSTDLAFTRGVFDGNLEPNTLTELRDLRRAETEACLNLDYINVISSFHSEELKQLGATDVEVFPAPFDSGPFSRAVENKTPTGLIRRSSELKDLLTIAFVGRPDRRKGLEVLFESCTALQKEKRKFLLLIVGSGFRDSKPSDSAHDGEHYLSFAQERYKVDLKPFDDAGGTYKMEEVGADVRRVAECYAASDIVVVPSLYEPMGYVVLEAMASGKAIVASNTGGIPEMLTDRQTGLLFPPGDADKLADCLRELMDKPELREALGAAARACISSRDSAAQSVRRFDDLYLRAALDWARPLEDRLAAETLARINKLCEEYSKRYPSFTIHSAAAAACEIAAQVGSLTRKDKATSPLVDIRLFRIVAERVKSIFWRGGKIQSFQTRMMVEMMKDLALSYLNTESLPRTAITLSSQKTAARLHDNQWLEKALNGEKVSGSK